MSIGPRARGPASSPIVVSRITGCPRATPPPAAPGPRPARPRAERPAAAGRRATPPPTAPASPVAGCSPIDDEARSSPTMLAADHARPAGAGRCVSRRRPLRRDGIAERRPPPDSSANRCLELRRPRPRRGWTRPPSRSRPRGPRSTTSVLPALHAISRRRVRRRTATRAGRARRRPSRRSRRHPVARRRARSRSAPPPTGPSLRRRK